MTILEPETRPVECECLAELSVAKLTHDIADEHGLAEDGWDACFKAFLLGLAFAAVAPEWAMHTYADVIIGLAVEDETDPTGVREHQRKFVREWTAKYPAGGRR